MPACEAIAAPYEGAQVARKVINVGGEAREVPTRPLAALAVVYWMARGSEGSVCATKAELARLLGGLSERTVKRWISGAESMGWIDCWVMKADRGRDCGLGIRVTPSGLDVMDGILGGSARMGARVQ